ncbi:MAG TPA: xanthine dehydrogenase accessory protein XdhC [Casimicrobiaceae bacterium]|nr:xanthine dehydrogenase accessory protein XdhC [Casimicrobiaceae bacterium]
MIACESWQEALHSAIARGGRAVLVTVAATTGSTPREAGAAMAITENGQAGTIGGGHLEFEATRLAHEALRDVEAATAWLVRFPLAARLGQCCGGVATLLFAVIDRSALPWLEVVGACMRSGTPHALVSVIGSSETAAMRLVITGDDVRGSLGSIALDSSAILEARARLALPIDDAQSGSAIVNAGGAMLFVHVVRPAAFPVLVFGNGHVGTALVHVLGALPARVTWIDTREHSFAPAGSHVEIVATDAPEDAIASAPRGAYVVIATHSHALDFTVLHAALAREDWSYLGLIGSKSKRAQFERRLLARGVPPESLIRFTCPIGQGSLRGKEPGVIAVSVVAQILALRETAGLLADRPRAQRGKFRV